MVDGEDAGRAGLSGEIGQLCASVKQSGEAVVAKTNVALCVSKRAGRGAANGHTETLKKIRTLSAMQRPVD